MKLHNFLLHSAVSCLLLRLVPLLLPTVDVAAVFAAVVAFAVHPVHCEAVAGIVGRAELLCAVWYVLGLLVWQRRRRTLGWGWLTDSMGVLAMAVLALLSKEHGVMLLPMCLVLDVVEDLFAERKRRRWLDGVMVIVRCLLRWRSVRLIVMTGGLVYVRLWVMGFQRPEFKVMDNPVAAAEVLQTKVFLCSTFNCVVISFISIATLSRLDIQSELFVRTEFLAAAVSGLAELRLGAGFDRVG